MRLDKFLKVSSIIKRRSVAQQIADLGGVTKDGRALKPSYDVKIGDVLTIRERNETIKIKVTEVPANNAKGDYYELLETFKD